MPAFGGEDSPQEIWRLVTFLRRLPQLSPEELKRMREMGGEAGKREMHAEPHTDKPETKPHKH